MVRFFFYLSAFFFVTRISFITRLIFREKGDASKVRDFLPSDRQYLVTRGVPCLRRATSLAYTDADEDAERLLTFNDGTPADGDEWVETHAGRKASPKTGGDHSEIAEIPDMDGHSDNDHDGLVDGIKGISIDGQTQGREPEVIDIDEIPDMEEDDLEAGDEATAAPKAPATVVSTSTPAAPRCVCVFLFLFSGN